MNVASVLPIGRPKCEKWHLTKTLGSLGFYISWFQFDPWLCLAVVWKKKRVFSWCFQWKNYRLLHFRIILGHIKNLHQFIHFHQMHQFCLNFIGKDEDFHGLLFCLFSFALIGGSMCITRTCLCIYILEFIMIIGFTLWINPRRRRVHCFSVVIVLQK